MGNACSCISKNKKLKNDRNGNNILSKEGNDNQIELDKIDDGECKQNEDCIYPNPPTDFEPDLVEPVGKNVLPLENELPNVEEYNVPAKQLDEHAIKIGKYNFPTFMSLMYNLIYNRSDNIKDNEYQKVCAVFSWLTTKNLHDFNFTNDLIYLPDSPEGILMGLSTGKMAYAQVFQILCRYSGLQCKLIRGYAKGVDYKPGMKFGSGKEAQHAWNAVKIDNIWYLFDCHWAAKRLMGKSINFETLKFDLDLFFFMTNPMHLRYTHLPFDDEWQLTKSNITLDQFENLTLIKPTFFKYNLELYSHTQAVLEVQNELILMIKVPIDLVDKISVTFTLTLEGLGEIYEGLNLTRYGIQEIQKKTGLCIINFRFPKSGSYKLLLYAREYGDTVFGGICEYKINSKLIDKYIVNSNGKKGIEEYIVTPYPPTQQSAYGKTEIANLYNVKCLHEDTSIHQLSDGIFEVSFMKNDEDNNNFPRLMARVKSSIHEESKLTGRLLQRNTYKGNAVTKFITMAFLPEPGEYALEIYANNPEKEGSSFFLIWQIFISTDKGSNLPEGLLDFNPGSAIGSQPQFQELNMKLLTHSDPYINLANEASPINNNETHDLVIDIGFPENNAIKVLGQLVDVSSSEEEMECSDYLLQQSFLEENSLFSVSFCLRFPKSCCFYKLHIYATSTTSETDTLPMVFSYMINVPHRLGNSDKLYFGILEGIYPYQLSQWKDKCRLIEPINRNIKIDDSNTTITFSLQVVDAFYVALVISGEEWHQFSKINNINCTWSGSVNFRSSIEVGSKISICACYNEFITSYITILEYYIS